MMFFEEGRRVEVKHCCVDYGQTVGAYRALSEISDILRLGKPEQALFYAQTAMRLDPNHAGNCSFDA